MFDADRDRQPVVMDADQLAYFMELFREAALANKRAPTEADAPYANFNSCWCGPCGGKLTGSGPSVALRVVRRLTFVNWCKLFRNYAGIDCPRV